MTRHFTAREFNQDVAAAKRATLEGPVFITDRGRPAQVLLSIEEYRQITGTRPSLADLLSNPEVAEIDFDLPERRIEPDRPLDLD